MSSNKTILVVEDEQVLITALRKKMESVGFDVLTAMDGDEGMKIALKDHPDLILLDMILPVMDGVTFLEKIREDAWGKDVPIIILSNLSRAETISESKKKGVNAYLVKTDWKLSEVVQKVKYELGVI